MTRMVSDLFRAIERHALEPDQSQSTGRVRVWHPALIALGPVAFLYAHNIEQVSVDQVWFPAAISFAVAVISLASLTLLLRNVQKAALLTSFGFVCFFGYGFTVDLLYGVEVFGFALGRNRYLLALQFSIFLAGSIAVLRASRPLDSVTRALNVFGVVFLGLSMFTAGSHGLSQSAGVANAAPAPVAGMKPESELPNIFYLVMDGYGREDRLRQYHGVDNSDFVEFLQESGFYVAESSHSNYCGTTFSLYSTLNLRYADALAREMGPDAVSQVPLNAGIRRSVVSESLTSLGYELYSFDAPGFAHGLGSGTQIQAEKSPLVFTSMLIDRTPLGVFQPFTSAQYDAHRGLINFELDELEDLADLPGPAFVFVHALVPHPPFVFAADGSPSNPPRGYVLSDGQELADYIAHEGRTLEEQYSRPYGEQLSYLNHRLREIIPAIQRSATRPTVIILQGDHGPGAHLRSDLAATEVHERFSIMNSYYFDDGDYSSLDPEITPVNSFRVIFDKYFGTDLSKLEDRSFWFDYARPYHHIEVTDRLRMTKPDHEVGLAPASHEIRRAPGGG